MLIQIHDSVRMAIRETPWHIAGVRCRQPADTRRVWLHAWAIIYNALHVDITLKRKSNLTCTNN